MESSEVLAIVGGHVEEEILLRNEYLAAENEILKSKFDKPLRFTHEESSLGEDRQAPRPEGVG